MFSHNFVEIVSFLLFFVSALQSFDPCICAFSTLFLDLAAFALIGKGEQTHIKNVQSMHC